MAETMGESQVGRLAVDRKFLTPEQLHDCFEEQKRLLAEGKRVSLTEIMLKLEYVTRSQLGRLSSDMEDSIAQKAQQIPGYRILGKLGAGAMATVFKAEQRGIL